MSKINADWFIENWREVCGGVIVLIAAPVFIYFVFKQNPKLSDYNERDSIHNLFERDAKAIDLPNRFTLKQFEKDGKYGSSILDSVSYQTSLSVDAAEKKTGEELTKKGWRFLKKENREIKFCKDKYAASVYVGNSPDANLSAVTIYFSLGLGGDC